VVLCKKETLVFLFSHSFPLSYKILSSASFLLFVFMPQRGSVFSQCCNHSNSVGSSWLSCALWSSSHAKVQHTDSMGSACLGATVLQTC